ncbi:MAG: TerB family tellurite resistance protein [Pseudomonadales bacterium]|nr:TerB family tellurite resistance protein [Pseudomonadales bacterium]
MLKKIQSFFETHLNPSTTDGSEQSRDHVVKLTSSALLIELIKVDHEVTEEEQAAVFQALKNGFGLEQQELDELVELAEAEVKDATSLYQFTSLVNEHYNTEEKSQLLEALWHVAFADGNIDRYEENLIRRVCELIHLSHSDFIQAKIKAQK